MIPVTLSLYMSPDIPCWLSVIFNFPGKPLPTMFQVVLLNIDTTNSFLILIFWLASEEENGTQAGFPEDGSGFLVCSSGHAKTTLIVRVAIVLVLVPVSENVLSCSKKSARDGFTVAKALIKDIHDFSPQSSKLAYG